MSCNCDDRVTFRSCRCQGRKRGGSTFGAPRAPRFRQAVPPGINPGDHRRFGALLASHRAFNPQPEPPRMLGRKATFGQADHVDAHGGELGGGGMQWLQPYYPPDGGYGAPPDEGDGEDLTTGGGYGQGSGPFGPVPPGFVGPGAVPVRLENWDLEAQPFATYKIAGGDTFSGLAATYMGDGTRWPEIWNTGKNRQKFPNPDVIMSTGPLDMPEEVRERMKAWLKTGKTGLPGDKPMSKVNEINKPKWPYVVAAGVALAAIGGVLYLASDDAA